VAGPGSSSSGTRKSVSYNRLQTHDKSDFLSSSNPNLLDIVGSNHREKASAAEGQGKNGDAAASAGQSDTLPQSRSSLKSNGKHYSSSSHRDEELTRNGGGVTEGRKFTFPSRVSNHDEEEEDEEDHYDDCRRKTRKKGDNTTACSRRMKDHGGGCSGGGEDSDDSNWIECDDDEDDDDDDDESDYSDEDEENARRCGYCGCEKKYTMTAIGK
jgi:hypothetical protein